MSYILEALKKSEQQRGDDTTPTVHTIHSASLQYTRPKKTLWPWVMAWVLAVVITLNVIALIVFFAPASQEAPAPRPAATPSSAPPAATRDAPASVKPVPQQKVDGAVANAEAATPATPPPQTTLPVDAPATPTAPPRSNTAAQSAFIVDFHDLPPHIQREIPEMVFSAHVYSSNPAQRSVVINGNFMEQGDMLNAQLRLEEITADGVVFDFNGTRFHSSVISHWKIR